MKKTLAVFAILTFIASGSALAGWGTASWISQQKDKPTAEIEWCSLPYRGSSTRSSASETAAGNCLTQILIQEQKETNRLLRKLLERT